DDLIDGLLTFMDAPGVRSPMNLGNPEEFTILELAELVIELTGSRSRAVFLPLPHDDPTQRCPDIELARRELGWKPRVALREGLARTVIFFDSVLQREHAAARPAGKVNGRGKRKPQRISTETPASALVQLALETDRVRH